MGPLRGREHAVAASEEWWTKMLEKGQMYVEVTDGVENEKPITVLHFRPHEPSAESTFTQKFSGPRDRVRKILTGRGYRRVLA